MRVFAAFTADFRGGLLHFGSFLWSCAVFWVGWGLQFFSAVIQTSKNDTSTNLPAVFPEQRCVGCGSHCPAALSSVCSAAPPPSAGEPKLPAAAETAGPPTKPDPRSDEPEGEAGGQGER